MTESAGSPPPRAKRGLREIASAWLDRFDLAGRAAGLSEVLAEERAEIYRRRRIVTKPNAAGRRPASGPQGEPSAVSAGEESRPPGRTAGEARQKPPLKDLAGIALSGGGIRSATFCLGVLQALQERGALRVFDYLSTVSGGGFVGGWWSAWLSRAVHRGDPGSQQAFPPSERIEPERETDYLTGAAPDIQRGSDLGMSMAEFRPIGQDPVHHLRLFSNYLTPRKGVLSADTWRAAAVVTRNLLLTWVVLLPLLVAVLAIGQIYFLATPAAAHGFVCASSSAWDPPPACTVVQDRLALLPDSLADSVRAVTDRLPSEVRGERLRYASTPVLVFVGWILVTTLLWLLTGARDLTQLTAIVVGLAASATLLHSVAERFTPTGTIFHTDADGPWVAIFKAGAGLILLFGWVIPLILDERFLTGRGRDDRREVRTNLGTRIHAGLLATTAGLALVLAVGGFAPDLFDFLFGSGEDQGAIVRGAAQAGGWLALLTSAAGTLVTIWSAAPSGGADTAPREPGPLRRALLAVTPIVVLLLLGVVVAAGLRSGLAHLPLPGRAARTPFFALVPGILAIAILAVGFRWFIVRGSALAIHPKRVFWGLCLAFVGTMVAFLIYYVSRPLEKLEPLGTSVLVAVLLAGFFTIFEYLTDESGTPRGTRVRIVLLASLVALDAGLLAAIWSPLGWGRFMPDSPPRLPAALMVGLTIGLVLARCSVTWTVDNATGKEVLRSRAARLRNVSIPTAWLRGVSSRLPWLQRLPVSLPWLHRVSLAGVAAKASLVAGVVLGGLAGWWLANRPIPFDAVVSLTAVDEATRRFATFCVAALAFCSAFILIDLWLSRADSRRALGLQVLAAGLLGPTLMQQYLDPLAPSVMFVNAELAFAGIAIAVVMGLGWLVDPNTIALHTFYRARLVRAYLGASNPARATLVTEAAEGDDLPLSTLGNCRHGGPYHLINTTLNLVGGRDLTTAQRSAANFTLSALYCGSLRTGYRPTYDYMGNQMTLGTAMAISGAAASPNMGSKTPSAALTMWLAFLNVRLGFWAPTPHRPRWRSPQPRLWPFYLVSECLSQTNDLGSYCYLTDGGHFDNTGLHALVERGCRYIVVVDCGADPRPCFGDIGDAVRRCRIDFDAEIELKVAPFTKGKKGFAESHYVVGTLVYSKAHAERLGWGPDVGVMDRTGILVWLKPSRRPFDPADVQQYGLENKEFPQQTTGDQWFSEAQFESYRRLGLETGREMLGSEEYQHPGTPLDVRGFFERIYQRYSG